MPIQQKTGQCDQILKNHDLSVFYSIIKGMISSELDLTKIMAQDEEAKNEAAEGKDEIGSTETSASELEESRWSVVSFEKRAAKNLTYPQAAEKLKQLKAKKVSGLCIITDEAAARISKQD